MDLQFEKGMEADLAKAIATIAKALAPNAAGIPDIWPGDRFNAIFRLDRPDHTAPWAFSQMAPVLLAGDRTTPI